MPAPQDDPTLYRVTLLCSCNMDAAFGYGPTPEAARDTAIFHFRKHHGRREKWIEEVLERAVPNGPGSTASHYEEVT